MLSTKVALDRDVGVALRAVTFLVNAVLLHLTSLAFLGVANVRYFHLLRIECEVVVVVVAIFSLALLYSTICFFAREAFRRSLLRPQKQFFEPAICNVVWLCPFISVVVGVLFGLVWIYVLVPPDDSAETKYYRTSVWLYVLAVVIESVAEPLWLLFQNLRILKPRHGVAKQFLTEGERYMMTFFNLLSFTDQGVLNVIYNLGSLFPRILLAPLEESAYAYFSQHVERGKTIRFQNEKTSLSVHQTLCNLLKLVSLIGLAVVIFGQSYSYTFLKMYAGERLCNSAGPLLLKYFSTYIWLLAINGITECFMFASMQNRQLDRHRYSMLHFCIVYLLSSFILCRIFGSVGFILANCINIAFRIIYSFRFIHYFYQGGGDRFRFPALSILPNSSVQGILLIIFCCEGFFNTFTHVTIGVLLLFATAMTTLIQEPELAQFMRTFFLNADLRKSA
ncbi:protein RFT1 [Trichuris trichiura]|uniref:Protein RFT1 homolog n=1 Tax=Trichuris trichiura TaxID=36087 RepID=A0A077YZ38_TRITR|nr:protein RFT1 [Trichuris trichiura]